MQQAIKRSLKEEGFKIYKGSFGVETVKDELDFSKLIKNLNTRRGDAKYTEMVIEYNGKSVIFEIFRSVTFIAIYPLNVPFVRSNLNDYLEWVHPCASDAAFKLFASKVFDDYKFPYYDTRELQSDTIEQYKKRLIGATGKFPAGFISTLKDFERDMLYRYMIFFAAGYTADTACELTRKELVRYKLSSIAYSSDIYSMIEACDIGVKPWEVVKSSSKFYENDKVIYDAIDAMIKEFNIDIDSVRIQHLQAFAPNLYYMFKHDGKLKGAMDRLRLFYLSYHR